MRRLIPGLFVLSLGISGAAAADPVTLISSSSWLYDDGSPIAMNLSGKALAAGSGAALAFQAFAGGTHTASGSQFMSTQPLITTLGGLTQRAVPGNAHIAPVVVSNPAAPPNQANHGSSALSGAVQLFTVNQASALFSNNGGGPSTVAQGVSNGLPGRGVVTVMPAADPSPTPEPASLLLLGTGLAAAVWQSRRARRAN